MQKKFALAQNFCEEVSGFVKIFGVFIEKPNPQVFSVLNQKNSGFGC